MAINITTQEEYGRIFVKPDVEYIYCKVSEVTLINGEYIVTIHNCDGANIYSWCDVYSQYPPINNASYAYRNIPLYSYDGSTAVVHVPDNGRSITTNSWVGIQREESYMVRCNGQQITTFVVPTKDTNYAYVDDTSEQGTTMSYSVTSVRSGATSTASIAVDFEDILISDGHGNCLRVRYNPKVSSFKTTILEQKMDTIGYKYPFFFRNGDVSYKEIPVSGLISYHVDEQMLFHPSGNMSDYFPMAYSKRNRTVSNATIVEYNEVYLERKYKRAVEEWLANGEPKLLRTATEGNFIVRFMNVSLTPMEQLGRRLHSFSATAYEIDDYTLNNLKKYGFIFNDITPEPESEEKIEETIPNEEIEPVTFALRMQKALPIVHTIEISPLPGSLSNQETIKFNPNTFGQGINIFGIEFKLLDDVTLAQFIYNGQVYKLTQENPNMYFDISENEDITARALTPNAIQATIQYYQE